MPSAIRSILMIPTIFTLAAAAAYRACLSLAPRAPRQAIRTTSAVLFLALGFECYHSYFDVWAKDPNVPIAFGAASVDIASKRFRKRPRNT
jgi:hypothetical protein